MLNISVKSISNAIKLSDFEAYRIFHKSDARNLPMYITLAGVGIVILMMFLPWTQNIQAKGYVTTLYPNQKPQAIHSVISGRLEEWYVREGNFVEAGDTIVFISEVKSEYFDPNLVERTTEQMEAKAQSVVSYDDKITALELQYRALEEARDLKIAQTHNKILQAKNKIQGDSIDLIAYNTNLAIAEKQNRRTQELYDRGLKSLTELEMKNMKLQEAQAKVIVQENKLLNSRNELLNLKIELSTIESEYADKLAKSQSDKLSALSDKLNATANTAKLRNELRNYSERQKLYYITAPQAGYITKAIEKGIGEIVKEGTDIITIMPEKYDLAVEIYIRPRDFPLLDYGQEVRILFDGWPAIVFSGWPNTSVGTFAGEVVAIDQFISDNGKYRLLIAPKEEFKEWPDLLRVGSGAQAFILLNDVPVWYEIWRQLNGFPPDFYAGPDGMDQSIKRKAPLKSVK